MTTITSVWTDEVTTTEQIIDGRDGDVAREVHAEPDQAVLQHP